LEKNTVEFPVKEEKAPEPAKIKGMAVCEKCKNEYTFIVDSGGADEIEIECPKCHEKTVIGSYKTEVWLKEHVEKSVDDIFKNTNIDGVLMICFNEEGYSMAGFGRDEQQKFEGSVILGHMKSIMDVRGDLCKAEYDRLIKAKNPGGTDIPQ